MINKQTTNTAGYAFVITINKTNINSNFDALNNQMRYTGNEVSLFLCKNTYYKLI